MRILKNSVSQTAVLFSGQQFLWCTDLGKQADWVGVKAYASTLTGVTWRGAVKALGWPLPTLDV